MAVFVVLLCCLGFPLVPAMSLTFGIDHISYGSLFPVHYRLTDRYSLARPHGKAGTLQHVDVDNVYNGHDIVGDDKDDSTYGQSSSKRNSQGYDNGDSYDGGIEDTYNKALHNAGHNDVYTAGVNHIGDGFDFGIEKRYSAALRNAGNKNHRTGVDKFGKIGYSNIGSKHNVGDNYNNGKSASGYGPNTQHIPAHKNTGYGKNNDFGHSDNLGFGRKSASGYRQDSTHIPAHKNTGYGNNNGIRHGDNFGSGFSKSDSGYGSNTKHNPVHKNTGFGNSNGFGKKDNFGPGFGKFEGHGSYKVAPHVDDINLSGVHAQRSRFPHQQRNIHNSYGNQYGKGNGPRGPRGDHPTYARSYQSGPVTHGNSYPPENNSYSPSNSYRPNTYHE